VKDRVELTPDQKLQNTRTTDDLSRQAWAVLDLIENAGWPWTPAMLREHSGPQRTW
jgi:hypothetical protein